MNATIQSIKLVSDDSGWKTWELQVRCPKCGAINTVFCSGCLSRIMNAYRNNPAWVKCEK